jgi:hypothetical protein
LNWPYYGNYQTCPVCEERCDMMSIQPMNIAEAEELVSMARREREAAKEARSRAAEIEAKLDDVIVKRELERFDELAAQLLN